MLHARHGTMMCVTLGRSGAMIVDDGRVHYAPAFAVDAVDTTGAGDVFRGAFIYGLLRGDEPPALLRFANAAAAVSCTRRGAMNGGAVARGCETDVRDLVGSVQGSELAVAQGSRVRCRSLRRQLEAVSLEQP